ncbi:hypothetical protein BN1013_01690 [Candidatus Rubidus massiliensis]|nr:hypothetical protein BN1013_01690 [Candidatus Rubidus massiliensis]
MCNPTGSSPFLFQNFIKSEQEYAQNVKLDEKINFDQEKTAIDSNTVIIEAHVASPYGNS